MRVDFFIVPARGGEAAAKWLSRLLAGVRVLSVDRQFVADGDNSFWSICMLSQSGLLGWLRVRQTECAPLSLAPTAG